jgi:hypothetical protein
MGNCCFEDASTPSQSIQSIQAQKEHSERASTILSEIKKVSENVKVALKFPHGVKGISYQEGKTQFEPCDINEWIQSIYASSKWTGWLLYNDETTQLGDKSTKKGHCKGILTWNDTHVSWLVHSVPNFPRVFTGSTISSIEPSEHMYGQSFFYTSRAYDKAFLERVIRQVYHMEAHIFKSHNEPAIPFVQENNVRTLTFSDTVTHLAKSPHCEIDIYSQHLALHDTSLWHIQTWKRGMPITTPCINVKEVDTVQWNDIQWKTSQDHSKWAVSESYYWIGDLNRMTSQLKRGGGGFLVKNVLIAKALRQLIGAQDVMM